MRQTRPGLVARGARDVKDPAPFWSLTTGRPLAVHPEILLVGGEAYCRHEEGWRTPAGKTLAPLPEGYEPYWHAVDEPYSLLTGPMAGVEVDNLPPELSPMLEQMGFRGLWLFRVENGQWVRVAGAPFSCEDEHPGAHFAPDHRAVVIEGAWAYRFRPENCKLWLPETRKLVDIGCCGAVPAGPSSWAYGDERGRLCLCDANGQVTVGEDCQLDELRQVASRAGYVFSGGEQACIWDERLKLRARLEKGLVWDLIPSERGDRLMTRFQKEIHLWAVPEGKLVLRAPVSDPEECRYEQMLFVTSAGDWFLVARFSKLAMGKYWCWAVNGRTLEQRRLELPANTCWKGCSIFADGRLVVFTREGHWLLHGPDWKLQARLEASLSGDWVVTTPDGRWDASHGTRPGKHVPGLWEQQWAAPPVKRRGWF